MFKKKKSLFSKKAPMLSKGTMGILIAYRKGYRVTENGHMMSPSGKSLSLKAASGRYPTVTVTENGITYNVAAHRLAAYCFYGREVFKEGLLVRHLNGNVSDIRKSNIALGTYTDNSMDRPLHQRVSTAVAGRKAQKRPHNAKFTPEQVRYIRHQREKGQTLQAIADKFGVSRQAIHRIVKRKYYSDVE